MNRRSFIRCALGATALAVPGVASALSREGDENPCSGRWEDGKFIKTPVKFRQYADIEDLKSVPLIESAADEDAGWTVDKHDGGVFCSDETMKEIQSTIQQAKNKQSTYILDAIKLSDRGLF